MKRRIILGTYVLSSGYYDAYYLRAQKVRTLIRERFHAFEKVDAIVCPTSPEPHSRSATAATTRSRCISRIFSPSPQTSRASAESASRAGLRDRWKKTPVGLQLLGKPFDEANLLKIAHAYEQSTEWHKEKPPLGD